MPDSIRICGDSDGPAAQDDLVGLGGEDLAARFQLHAGGLVPVEQDPVHVAVGLDGEIQAVPGFRQVAQVGAHADAVGVVEGRWPLRRRKSGWLWSQVSGKPAATHAALKAFLRRQPRFSGEAVHHDGPFAAVEVVVAVVGGRFSMRRKIGSSLVYDHSSFPSAAQPS